MEKVTTKKAFYDLISNIRAVEMKARESYLEDIATFGNFKIKNTIMMITKDEDMHIKILEDVLLLLK